MSRPPASIRKSATASSTCSPRSASTSSSSCRRTSSTTCRISASGWRSSRRDASSARARRSTWSRELAGRVWHKTIDNARARSGSQASTTSSPRASSAAARSSTCSRPRQPEPGFEPGAGRARGRLLLDAVRRAPRGLSENDPCSATLPRSNSATTCARRVFWTTALIFALLTFGADYLRPACRSADRLATSRRTRRSRSRRRSQIMSHLRRVHHGGVRVQRRRPRRRDGLRPIVRSTRVSTFDYLFGRFTGAFVVGCLAFASVPLAMLIGSFMPWIDPETLGPFRPGDYLYVYFAAVALPTLLMMARILFRARDDDALDARRPTSASSRC